MTITNAIYSIGWIVNKQFGINFVHIIKAIQGFPRFIRTYYQFINNYNGELIIKPCLRDWFEEGGETKNEYFLQDLYVAQRIYQASPNRHIDIGSRVDGFVAHIASFREIEVLDIRPVNAKITGITFQTIDIMKKFDNREPITDSLSCLHALEHFGLGRYGDNVDPAGYKRALSNISSLIVIGGTFYLSVPVGKERVEFNAHRIFNPTTLLKDIQATGMELTSLAAINQQNLEIFNDMDNGLEELGNRNYSLGLFIFHKKS